MANRIIDEDCQQAGDEATTSKTNKNTTTDKKANDGAASVSQEQQEQQQQQRIGTIMNINRPRRVSRTSSMGSGVRRLMEKRFRSISQLANDDDALEVKSAKQWSQQLQSHLQAKTLLGPSTHEKQIRKRSIDISYDDDDDEVVGEGSNPDLLAAPAEKSSPSSPLSPSQDRGGNNSNYASSSRLENSISTDMIAVSWLRSPTRQKPSLSSSSSRNNNSVNNGSYSQLDNSGSSNASDSNSNSKQQQQSQRHHPLRGRSPSNNHHHHRPPKSHTTRTRTRTRTPDVGSSTSFSGAHEFMDMSSGPLNYTNSFSLSMNASKEFTVLRKAAHEQQEQQQQQQQRRQGASPSPKRSYTPPQSRKSLFGGGGGGGGGGRPVLAPKLAKQLTDFRLRRQGKIGPNNKASEVEEEGNFSVTTEKISGTSGCGSLPEQEDHHQDNSNYCSSEGDDPAQCDNNNNNNNNNNRQHNHYTRKMNASGEFQHVENLLNNQLQRQELKREIELRREKFKDKLAGLRQQQKENNHNSTTKDLASRFAKDLQQTITDNMKQLQTDDDLSMPSLTLDALVATKPTGKRPTRSRSSSTAELRRNNHFSFSSTSMDSIALMADMFDDDDEAFFAMAAAGQMTKPSITPITTATTATVATAATTITATTATTATANATTTTAAAGGSDAQLPEPTTLRKNTSFPSKPGMLTRSKTTSDLDKRLLQQRPGTPNATFDKVAATTTTTTKAVNSGTKTANAKSATAKAAKPKAAATTKVAKTKAATAKKRVANRLGITWQRNNNNNNTRVNNRVSNRSERTSGSGGSNNNNKCDATTATAASSGRSERSNESNRSQQQQQQQKQGTPKLKRRATVQVAAAAISNLEQSFQIRDGEFVLNPRIAAPAATNKQHNVSVSSKFETTFSSKTDKDTTSMFHQSFAIESLMSGTKQQKAIDHGCSMPINTAEMPNLFEMSTALLSTVDENSKSGDSNRRTIRRNSLPTGSSHGTSVPKGGALCSPTVSKPKLTKARSTATETPKTTPRRSRRRHSVQGPDLEESFAQLCVNLGTTPDAPSSTKSRSTASVATATTSTSQRSKAGGGSVAGSTVQLGPEEEEQILAATKIMGLAPPPADAGTPRRRTSITATTVPEDHKTVEKIRARRRESTRVSTRNEKVKLRMKDNSESAVSSRRARDRKSRRRTASIERASDGLKRSTTVDGTTSSPLREEPRQRSRTPNGTRTRKGSSAEMNDESRKRHTGRTSTPSGPRRSRRASMNVEPGVTTPKTPRSARKSSSEGLYKPRQPRDRSPKTNLGIISPTTPRMRALNRAMDDDSQMGRSRATMDDGSQISRSNRRSGRPVVGRQASIDMSESRSEEMSDDDSDYEPTPKPAAPPSLPILSTRRTGAGSVCSSRAEASVMSPRRKTSRPKPRRNKSDYSSRREKDKDTDLPDLVSPSAERRKTRNRRHTAHEALKESGVASPLDTVHKTGPDPVTGAGPDAIQSPDQEAVKAKKGTDKKATTERCRSPNKAHRFRRHKTTNSGEEGQKDETITKPPGRSRSSKARRLKSDEARKGDTTKSPRTPSLRRRKTEVNGEVTPLKSKLRRVKTIDSTLPSISLETDMDKIAQEKREAESRKGAVTPELDGNASHRFMMKGITF